MANIVFTLNEGAGKVSAVTQRNGTTRWLVVAGCCNRVVERFSARGRTQ